MSKKYCEKYDAYFESKTCKWLELKCKDDRCPYCSRRPDKHKLHKWTFIHNGKEEICK